MPVIDEVRNEPGTEKRSHHTPDEMTEINPPRLSPPQHDAQVAPGRAGALRVTFGHATGQVADTAALGDRFDLRRVHAGKLRRIAIGAEENERPEHDDRRIQDARMHPVRQPAARQLQQRLGPGKGGEHQAELYRIEVKVTRHGGRGDRDIATIEVVDDDRDEQQPHDAESPVRRFR